MSSTLHHACVDIGGTKVAVSLATAQSAHTLQLHARCTEPTAKEGAPDALSLQVIRLIGAACAKLGINESQIASVGVSSCGPFVLQGGMIALAAPNICGGLRQISPLVGHHVDAVEPAKFGGLPNNWLCAPLEAPLAARYGQVRVVNDAIGALEAERRWGALQGLSHCAYVTWSTGIGVGLCVDGHVLRGKNGNAGHAGHIYVSEHPDAACGCGNYGDLEAIVSGSAIPRRFSQEASVLFAAARAGDAAAMARVDELCSVMGRALYNLIVTLDLERISLGGSVFWHQQDMILPKLRAHIAGKLPSLTAGCSLVPAGLGLAVGDLGALALLPTT